MTPDSDTRKPLGIPRKGDDEYATTKSQRNHVQRQRDRYAAAGLVQVSVWIPAENKQELMQDCARLRVRHLKHVGYWDRDDD